MAMSPRKRRSIKVVLLKNVEIDLMSHILLRRDYMKTKRRTHKDVFERESFDL